MLEKTITIIKSSCEIYIRLLDEGTDVFRPTQAQEIGNGLFKVLPTSDYNSDSEVWEFAPGSIVKCEIRNFHNGKHLFASEKVS